MFFGTTNKSIDEIKDYVRKLCEEKFKVYNLVANNCCNFTNALSMFVLKKPIPSYFLYQFFSTLHLLSGSGANSREDIIELQKLHIESDRHYGIR